MKNSLRLIILFVFILALFGLYSFANQKFATRKCTGITVYFHPENPGLITPDAVNKLLIQNKDTVTNRLLDNLILNEMETALADHPMIKEAQVFVDVKGQLQAVVWARKPIARVMSKEGFYIDADGQAVPLSTQKTMHVPIVTGAVANWETVLPLLLEIPKDAFLQKAITEVIIKPNQDVVLKIRSYNLDVYFGKPIAVSQKLRNFKAFYKKIQADNRLDIYQQVNLKFNNQVIPTKR